MAVRIGEVETFPHPVADKAQALKPIEEAAEVYAAWQYFDWCITNYFGDEKIVDDLRESMKKILVDEIADCIEACCNLAMAIGVDDMGVYMDACAERNRSRGRM